MIILYRFATLIFNPTKGSIGETKMVLTEHLKHDTLHLSDVSYQCSTSVMTSGSNAYCYLPATTRGTTISASYCTINSAAPMNLLLYNTNYELIAESIGTTVISGSGTCSTVSVFYNGPSGNVYLQQCK